MRYKNKNGIWPHFRKSKGFEGQKPPKKYDKGHIRAIKDLKELNDECDAYNLCLGGKTHATLDSRIDGLVWMLWFVQ